MGRPIRIPESENVYLRDTSPLDLPATKRKLKLVGEGEKMDPIPVTEHHLDTNRHVNNGQYVAMADSAVRVIEEDFALRRLYVQYKKAAQLNDVIVPTLFKEPGGYAVDLADENGSTFAIVRMERA